MGTSADRYEQDFHACTEEQVRQLRAGLTAEADPAQIAEESETSSTSERRKLESRLEVLLQHLRTWRCQPDARSPDWAGSSAEQRDQLDTLLRRSPSLRRLVPEYIGDAYRKAQRAAMIETGRVRAAFPEH